MRSSRGYCPCFALRKPPGGGFWLSDVGTFTKMLALSLLFSENVGTFLKGTYMSLTGTGVTGRAKGGVQRAIKASPERLSEIGRLGAEIKKLPRATHGAADKPLVIGDIEITCYVLEDGRRVLAQRGLQQGIGLSQGGGHTGARRIAEFLARLEKKGIFINDLIARANSPIRFVPPHGGNPADGYDATILPDICAAIIAADQSGALDKRLKKGGRAGCYSSTRVCDDWDHRTGRRGNWVSRG